jgi:hypothetical protein
MSGYLFHNSWAVPTFEDADISEFEGFGIVEVYGLGSLTVAVCRRALPYHQATVHQATVHHMDIADFKRKCMAEDLSEIRWWMACIHTAIDEPLERHAVHKVEIR